MSTPIYGNNTKYHAVDKDNKKAQVARMCLKCSKKFRSMNIGNRLCVQCKGSRKFKEERETIDLLADHGYVNNSEIV